MQELPTSRAQVDSVTMRTRSMLPLPRQAAQLLGREAPRSTPARSALLIKGLPCMTMCHALLHVQAGCNSMAKTWHMQ